MPINRAEPRADRHQKRTMMSHKEKKRLAQLATIFQQVLMTAMQMHIVIDLRRGPESDRQFLKIVLKSMSVLYMQTVMMYVAKRRRSRARDFPFMTTMDDFSPEKFKELFRFRKEHFVQILHALGWLEATGEPVWIKHGRPRHAQTLRAGVFVYPDIVCCVDLLLPAVFSPAFTHVFMYMQTCNLHCDVL